MRTTKNVLDGLCDEQWGKTSLTPSSADSGVGFCGDMSGDILYRSRTITVSELKQAKP
jgi:hypothetical protein